jgi:DNA repair exonuclease SbcCD nuclease subunit
MDEAMKVLLYSDPHIGLNRLANTTQASAQRLREASFNQTHYLLTNLKQNGMLAFCLGDLFDQYSNDEAVIKQAMELIQHTDIVLAGNHDVSNRKDKVSSLELLHKVYGDKILIGPWGEPSVFQLEVGNTLFVFVPHAANQQLFDEALLEARSLAAECGKWAVLCAHSNYELNFENLQDTSLNLTKTAVDILLGNFHHIFLGHEHNPSELPNSRFAVVGNTFPSGFSDISDKRVIIYDTETGGWESQHTLSEDALVWRGRLSELPSETEAVFLDLEDDLPRGEGFKAVSKLYRSSEVFAIRLKAPSVEETKNVATIQSMATLPEVVGRDLEKNRPELVPLWEDLLTEVGADS